MVFVKVERSKNNFLSLEVVRLLNQDHIFNYAAPLFKSFRSGLNAC